MKGLVLSGGKSSRMGSPKAEINYHGEPEFLRCAKLLRIVCSDVYLSTSQNWAPASCDIPQIKDEPGTSFGPLSGLVAAFKSDPQSAWFVLACDLPRFDENALRELHAHKNANAQATCFLGYQGRPEPLCAIYEPSAAPAIFDAVANDKRCARKVMESLQAERVTPSNAHWVRNVNSLKDLGPPLEKGVGGFSIRLHIEFVAQLRESAGVSREEISTDKATPREVYKDLSLKYGFLLSPDHMRVAINDDMAAWDAPVHANDRLMFLPPVAGG